MQNIQQTTRTQTWVGHALADLPMGSVSLNVLVPELSPGALTGTFAPGTTKATVSTTDLTGATQSSTVTTANYIVATWDGESNQAYPPFIRQGEQVEVFQYSDSDKYYWKAKGRDRSLRQTDRQRMEVGAQGPTSAGKPTVISIKDDTNTYFFELDSVNKQVQLRTSKANGEAFAYAIRIDTKNSTVTISDDAQGTPNRILIDSNKHQVQMNNTDGTTLSLTGQDALLYAPRDILMRAGRQLVTDAPITTINKPGASKNVVSVNGSSFAMTMSQDVVMTTTRFGVNGAAKFNGPVITGPMRSVSYATGPLGGGYKLATTNITNGTASTPGNGTDTDTTGTGDRHAAAFEQVQQGFAMIVGYFQEVKAACGAPGNPFPLNDVGTASQIPLIKGA